MNPIIRENKTSLSEMTSCLNCNLAKTLQSIATDKLISTKLFFMGLSSALVIQSDQLYYLPFAIITPRIYAGYSIGLWACKEYQVRHPPKAN